MKPTLFVLAAGMGSRYGGLKQLDGIGPNGETIMDYSIYDSLKAGFGKVVFVIRRDFEDDFNRLILVKYRDLVPCEVCFQSIDKVPEGCSYTSERTKPWGTNHAVMMASEIIKEPFGVINADDFYGREAFYDLYNFLQRVVGKKDEYCVIGYPIENTLSEYGSVNRGVCENRDGKLVAIKEVKDIECSPNYIFYPDGGHLTVIPRGTLVSMNMWGFTTDYFAYSDAGFRSFLKSNGHDLKSEYYIPTLINELVQHQRVVCDVITTKAKWFGVTYANDKAQVVNNIRRLIDEGVYPKKLY